MADPYETLVEQFDKARRDAEMSQGAVALAMGTKQAYISEILSGKKRMGRKTLGAVLRVFPNLRPHVIAVLTTTGMETPSREDGRS